MQIIYIITYIYNIYYVYYNYSFFLLSIEFHVAPVPIHPHHAEGCSVLRAISKVVIFLNICLFHLLVAVWLIAGLFICLKFSR
jgi:hypothetical protein